jgi:hypothetical protein
MILTFNNDFHLRQARVTTKDWRLTQRQVRRLWGMLCGEVDCPVCEYGGLHGENRYRLRKLGGPLFNDGAQIV